MNTKKRLPLNQKNIEDILPLTPLQEGMLFHYLKNGSLEYIEQLVLILEGELNKEFLVKSWGVLTETNEVLRTVFRWDKIKNPVQIVLKQYELPLREYDYSGYSKDEADCLFQELLISDRTEGIDLHIAPIRITLVKFSNCYALIITNHHILYDGWSNGVLLKEFFSAYQELCAGGNVAPKIKSKFSEFIKYLINKDKDKEKAFWNEYLKGFDSKTAIPAYSLNQKELGNKKTYEYLESQGLLSVLRRNAIKMGTTPPTYLYAGWGMLLQRYCNSEDVVFGTTVSGRNVKIKGIGEIVGLFISTPPLRIKSDGNPEIITIIKNMNQALAEREEFESTPLVDIKACSELKGTEELFDSILVIENYPLERELLKSIDRIKITSYSMNEHTNYALTVTLDTFEDLKIKVAYDEGVFEKTFIQGMVQHYINILREIAIHSNKKVSEIDMLSEAEKKLLLHDFNNTYTEYPKEKAIHQLFEEQVERGPDNIAVVFKDESLTYRELNRRANRLARKLREKGVGPDNIVGIIVERSFEMIVGIMGILKAGGGVSAGRS